MDVEKCSLSRYPAEILGSAARPIEEIDDSVRRLVEKMTDIMLENKGVGLAGPQVGESCRVVIVHPPSADGEPRGDPHVLINPEVEERIGPEVSGEEGCLSIPGIYEMVKRPERVRARALDLEGNAVELDVDGMFSRILQHEIDHLDGVLFIDRIGPMRRALLKKRLRELRE